MQNSVLSRSVRFSVLVLCLVLTPISIAAQTLSVSDTGSVMRQVMNWYYDQTTPTGNCPWGTGVYSCMQWGTPISNNYRSCSASCRQSVCASQTGANTVFDQNLCLRGCTWGCHLKYVQACANAITLGSSTCAQLKDFPLKKFDPSRGTLNSVSLRVQRTLVYDVNFNSVQVPAYVSTSVWFLTQAELFSKQASGGLTLIQDTTPQHFALTDAWLNPQGPQTTYKSTEFFDLGDITYQSPATLVLADFIGTSNALSHRGWMDSAFLGEFGSGSFGMGTNALFGIRLELEYRYTPTGATIPVLTK